LNFPIRLQGNGDGATQHQRTIDDASDTAVAMATLLVGHRLSRTTGPPAGGIHGARHPVGAVGSVG
jgi:hypothetical protein